MALTNYEKYMAGKQTAYTRTELIRNVIRELGRAYMFFKKAIETGQTGTIGGFYSEYLDTYPRTLVKDRYKLKHVAMVFSKYLNFRYVRRICQAHSEEGYYRKALQVTRDIISKGFDTPLESKSRGTSPYNEEWLGIEWIWFLHSNMEYWCDRRKDSTTRYFREMVAFPGTLKEKEELMVVATKLGAIITDQEIFGDYFQKDLSFYIMHENQDELKDIFIKLKKKLEGMHEREEEAKKKAIEEKESKTPDIVAFDNNFNTSSWNQSKILHLMMRASNTTDAAYYPASWYMFLTRKYNRIVSGKKIKKGKKK